MKYFCAECQTKHEITEITADLYEVCIEEVRSNLLQVRDYGNSEEFLNRFFRISLFCNNPEASRRQFLFSRQQLEAHLINPVKNGSSMCGIFELNFQWLLDAYRNSGAAEADDKASVETEETLMDLESFSDEAKRCVIFSKEIDFVFSKVKGSAREYVFNYIAPGPSGKENSYTGMSYKRACPHCGKNLSRAVGMAPETVVALAGNPRAGKTSCITAIASALDADRYREFGLSMDANPHDDQWKALKTEIDRYNRGYIVEKTPTSLNTVPSYSYLLHVGKDTERVLTFVDMPGEFWQAGDGLSVDFYKEYAGLYENIDCVWFFISKLAVHAFDLGHDDDDTARLDIHDKLYRDKQTKLRQRTADSSDTINGSSAGKINSILKGLRNHLESKGHEMPPFAVILTKSEVVYDENNADEIGLMEKYTLFPASKGAIIRNNLAGCNNIEIQRVLGFNRDTEKHYLNEVMFHKRSAQVRDFICQINKSMCDVIEQNCPRRFYISMAAYGHAAAVPPDNTGERKADGVVPTKPTPFHEMYPLLWTLALTGGLQIRHGCSWFTYRSKMDELLKNGIGDFSHGTVEIPFNCANPLWFDKRKLSESERDQVQLWQDISANLLLNGSNPNKREYTTTVFDHPRR